MVAQSMHGNILLAIDVCPTTISEKAMTNLLSQYGPGKHANSDSYCLWLDRRDLYCHGLFHSFWVPSDAQELANQP